MNLRTYLKGGLAIFLLIMLNSCMDDDLWVERNVPNIDPSILKQHSGVIIINEGNYMYGNSSVYWYDKNKGNVYPDVYYRQNGSALGDVAQSAVVRDGLLYVVVNNSGRVLIMNYGKYPALKLFDFVGKISGLTSPRYMYFVNDHKAYISDLYARKINIADPQSMMLTGSVGLDNHDPQFARHPSEQMIGYGKFIFSNAYSYDNKILVVDSEKDLLTDSIEVLKQPSSMVADKEGRLWVLCDGGYEGSEYGDEDPGLVRINMATRTVEKVFFFKDDHWPSKLNINRGGDTLYFLNRDVWRMSIYDNELPSEAFIPAEDEGGIHYFYGLGIDPHNSEVYVGDALDRVQNGVVYRFSAKGMPLDTIEAGVLPGAFCFGPL